MNKIKGKKIKKVKYPNRIKCTYGEMLDGIDASLKLVKTLKTHSDYQTYYANQPNVTNKGEK